MRLLLASTYVPFRHGGDRKFLGGLKDALESRGHTAEIVLIPIRPDACLGAEQTLAIRLFDLTEASGNPPVRLIALQSSACALQHYNKVAWILNHRRHGNDLWGTTYEKIPGCAEARRNRDWMIRSDHLYLREAAKVYTNSKATADRLELYNGLSNNGILYPPLPRTENFRQGDFGDYFVYSANQNPLERHGLLIEAFRHVRSGLGLVVFGTSTLEGEEESLHRLVASLSCQDKIRILSDVSESDRATWIANACGVVSMEPESDSRDDGLLEAFHCHKPVITCSDSTANLELVRAGINGWVVDPEPPALADVMEHVWANKPKAVLFGHEAFNTLALRNISWDHVSEQLVA